MVEEARNAMVDEEIGIGAAVSDIPELLCANDKVEKNPVKARKPRAES
jgi:hypothetical protein